MSISSALSEKRTTSFCFYNPHFCFQLRFAAAEFHLSCRICEAALQLLLWRVYIFFLSLHLAGPASFVVLNFPLKPNSVVFFCFSL